MTHHAVDSLDNLCCLVRPGTAQWPHSRPFYLWVIYGKEMPPGPVYLWLLVRRMDVNGVYNRFNAAIDVM